MQKSGKREKGNTDPHSRKRVFPTPMKMPYIVTRTGEISKESHVASYRLIIYV
jgi:hypothetical protein